MTYSSRKRTHERRAHGNGRACSRRRSRDWKGGPSGSREGTHIILDDVDNLVDPSTHDGDSGALDDLLSQLTGNT